jgi:hypothetical protein
MDEQNTQPKKKGSAIELVKKQFQAKIAGKLNQYTVEEWGIDVYYRSITTLKQEAKIVELSTQGKNVEALVEAVIIKALDEDGKPLFSQYDKASLMNEADPAVILKLSRVLNGGDLPSVEEVEGN